MKSRAKSHQPASLAVHNLISKMSTIIGNCDLLLEKSELGTEQTQRLTTIRETAREAVKELVEHQRELEAHTRSTETRKAG